jgi:hypothetical protein
MVSLATRIIVLAPFACISLTLVCTPQPPRKTIGSFAERSPTLSPRGLHALREGNEKVGMSISLREHRLHRSQLTQSRDQILP